MQFLVTGYDGTDEQAAQRRLAARTDHLQGVAEASAKGEHLYGAALLNEEGKMIGSFLVTDYPNRELLDEWLKVEPYVLGKVWERIEVTPCAVAPIFMKEISNK